MFHGWINKPFRRNGASSENISGAGGGIYYNKVNLILMSKPEKDILKAFILKTEKNVSKKGNLDVYPSWT